MKKITFYLLLIITSFSCNNKHNEGQLVLTYLNHDCQPYYYHKGLLNSTLGELAGYEDDFFIECKNTSSDTLAFWVGHYPETPFSIFLNNEKKRMFYTWKSKPTTDLSNDSINVAPNERIKLLFVKTETITENKWKQGKFGEILYHDSIVIKMGDSIIIK